MATTKRSQQDALPRARKWVRDFRSWIRDGCPTPAEQAAEIPIKPETYAEWLARNPAPDLQRLVERWDGFSKVPVDAWTQFDQQMARWQERRRAFLQRT